MDHAMKRVVCVPMVVAALFSCAVQPASAESGAQPRASTAAASPTPTLQPNAPNSNQLVHGEVYFRTFRIRPQGVDPFGTGFLMQVDGREYLITAAHVIVGFKKTIEVWRSGAWINGDAKLVGSAAPKIDIAVLALETDASPPVSYDLTSGSLLTERLFFVGFPYGFATNATLNAGYPIPFIKSGILSGWMTDESGTEVGMYLDALNNPGFSGGPVVRPGLPVRIVGVVSGYRGVQSEVLGPDGKHLLDPTGKPLGLYTQENTGLLAAYDIRFALDLIRKNPIGPLVQGPAAQK